MIEDVLHKNQILAKIIRANYKLKKGINFFTPNHFSSQVAYMSHKKGHVIQPHIHKKKLKKIYDTNEVLIILDGTLKVDFYNNKKQYISSKILKRNDIIILLSGGHGFKILKKCNFIEVKQGPYNLKEDKYKF